MVTWERAKKKKIASDEGNRAPKRPYKREKRDGDRQAKKNQILTEVADAGAGNGQCANPKSARRRAGKQRLEPAPYDYKNKDTSDIENAARPPE